MDTQSGFDTFIEATRYLFRGPSPQEILILILVSSVFISLIVIPVIYMKIKEKAKAKEFFLSRAKDFDLTLEEAELLWNYLKTFPINPNLIFENKALFEKVVDKIVKNGDPEEIKLISTIRMKLRFTSLPWFIPLTTTRDIEVYQTGYLATGNQKVEAYVFDKDEEYIYIALLEPTNVEVGDKIQFLFLRENDGRYSFEGTVDRIFMDIGRIVLVIKHTDKLNRLQLRQSIRWKVKIPVTFTILEGEEIKLEGTIEDISLRGVRVCYQGNINIKEGQKVILDFILKSYKFENLLGTVVHKAVYEKKICMGVRFEGISRKEEEIIERFILDEQRKLLRAYKIGELEQ
ncbi:MAG TPA: PilZ domain-containing protein [Aquificaceae bacterium]|nr:PilZ domain-containing protein [Aquificaceae bacterium]HIQ48474.1 PilZ domain-containing protein [Aquifex aeolicus]